LELFEFLIELCPYLRPIFCNEKALACVQGASIYSLIKRKALKWPAKLKLSFPHALIPSISLPIPVYSLPNHVCTIEKFSLTFLFKKKGWKSLENVKANYESSISYMLFSLFGGVAMHH
jgi:hypothetical protein